MECYRELWDFLLGARMGFEIMAFKERYRILRRGFAWNTQAKSNGLRQHHDIIKEKH